MTGERVSSRAVVAVEDLDARAAIGRRERIRHRPQLRGELFVREARRRRGGRSTNAMSVTDCARPPRPVVLAAGGFGSVTLVNFTVLERDQIDLARAVDAQERRLGRRSLAAHHGRRTSSSTVGCTARSVMVMSAARGAEHGGDLLIDAGDVLRAGRAARGLGAEVEREDRRGLAVGGEQDAVGREGQRADGREGRPGGRADETGGGRRRGGRDRKREYGDEFQAGAHLNTAPSLRVWVGKRGDSTVGRCTVHSALCGVRVRSAECGVAARTRTPHRASVRRGILPSVRVTRLACVLAALLALAGGAAGPTRPVESTRFVVSCTWPGDPSADTRQTTQRAGRRSAPVLRAGAPVFALLHPRRFAPGESTTPSSSDRLQTQT